MEAGTKQKAPTGPVPDDELERRVMANRARREGSEAESDEPVEGKALLSKAAKTPEKLSEDETVSALDYFLATEEDPDPEIEPKSIALNLGGGKKVRWTIVPVEDTEITRLRRSSQVGTKSQKRRGEAEVDEAAVARKIVVRGTIDPDLKELARTMETGPDPADAVHAFFARSGKTGLITQISGEILSISGWDDEDVQEVEAARG